MLERGHPLVADHALGVPAGAEEIGEVPFVPVAHDGIPYRIARRATDLVLGALLGMVLLPVALLIAWAIRLDSPGPVLFRQRRVGRGGRPFWFYKFRTMHVDARERYPELYRYRYQPQQIATMYFKVIDDPRLTRFGRHLRRTSLDEIPNFINVLRGDMTLVGPRPELPEMVSYYRPEQMPKFSVTPGLTGLAQVSGRGILRFQETIAADLDYVRRRSYWLDLVIVARTVDAVVRRVGAF
jgi:lipopolysaccharide/colanic/teichoic acid biosynthesis glycosyltransferase